MSDDVEYYLRKPIPVPPVRTYIKIYLYCGPGSKDVEHVVFDLIDISFIMLLNQKKYSKKQLQESPFKVLLHCKDGRVRFGYVTTTTMSYFYKWDVLAEQKMCGDVSYNY